MYQVLSEFLTTFSSNFPILWALLVMVVVGATGLGLYGFWELVIKGMSALLKRSSTLNRIWQP